MPCPGSKIKSKGKGQALGIGKAKGPMGVPLYAKKKTWRNIAKKAKEQAGKKLKPLSKITCGEITRAFRTIRDLKGKVYVVGGLVTDGTTLRDIDIVISDIKDIPNIKKCLGKYASRAHFIHQKEEPPATLFVKVTGKDASSPGLFKGKGRMSKNEYANPT